VGSKDLLDSVKLKALDDAPPEEAVSTGNENPTRCRQHESNP
jgi:hypothetical protein